MPSRTRTKDERSNVSCNILTERYFSATCGGAKSWSVYGSYNFTVPVGKYSCMYDVVTPGFHARRSRGEVFFSPMIKQEYTVPDSPGGRANAFTETQVTCPAPNSYYANWRQTSSGCSAARYSANVGFPVDKTGMLVLGESTISPGDQQRALLEVATSVRSKRGRADFNLWETLAEIDKASASLSAVLKPALASLTPNKVRMLKRAKGSASAYLAWKFGVKPLISDVNSIMEGLNKSLGTMRKTSRESISLPGSRQVLGTGSWGGAASFKYLSRCDETLIIRAMSLDEFDRSRLDTLGLSGKDLVTLPWELVSLSFVVDYFVNIGDFIGSLVPAIGYKQLGSCVTSERQLKYSWYFTETVPGVSLTVDQPWAGSFTHEANEKTRSTGLPEPRVVIRADFRLDNISRALTLLALMVQRFK